MAPRRCLIGMDVEEFNRIVPGGTGERTFNVQRPTFNVQLRTTLVRHLYVHIPFCARICPYCAFYKERADPAQTERFCQRAPRRTPVVSRHLRSPARDHLLRRRHADRALDRAARICVLGGFQDRSISRS